MDQHEVVGHDKMVMVHAWTVVVIDAAVVVVVVVGMVWATDMAAAGPGLGLHGLHRNHPCFGVGRDPAFAPSLATGRDLGSHCIGNRRGCSFDL